MSFGEAFLRQPDAWADRAGAEPCGDQRMVLEVAGGPFLCRGLSAAQFGLLCRRFGQSPGSSTAAEIELRRAPAAEFAPVTSFPWEYRFDLEFRPDEVWLAGWDFAARLRLRPRLAATLWTPHLDGGMFESAFSNVFRVVVAYALVAAGGVLLHSAAVAEGGVALLFVGVSGAGKSTVSRLALASGRRVLSDDLNALLRESGLTFVERVPFTGELRDAPTVGGRFPLARVLRLRQGDAPALRALGLAEAVALLYGCAPFVNTDPLRREQVLANLESCVAGVSAAELSFAREGGFWHLLAGRKAS